MSIWPQSFLPFAFAGCFLGICLSTKVGACPGLMLGSQLPLGSWEASRDRVQLFTYAGGSEPWRPIALQIDPLDDEGNLLFPRERDWMQHKVRPTDRFSFRVQDFGSKKPKTAALPCPEAEGIELRSDGRFAYLLKCQDLAYKGLSPVQLNEQERRVKSAFYEYQFTKENHLIFDQIRLLVGDGTQQAVASKGDLLIVSDVRRFFTLVFDSSDIDARITSQRSGPMGLMGGLEFYLHILAFRIELALQPEVNFFGDSLFMPMMMHVPVDATRYLRRGSGIYYTWETAADTSWLLDKSQIEELQLDALDPESKSPLAKSSDVFCGPALCRYRLIGRLHGRLFALNFAINRKAADLGFYPRLIRDVPAVEKAVGRKISRYPAANRMGVYFETARLPKGTHVWDFWIHFPDDESTPCTVPVRARRVLTDKGVARP